MGQALLGWPCVFKGDGVHHNKKLLFIVAVLCSSCLHAADVNTASVAQLDGIHGMGPALSTRIVNERQIRPFTDWLDLRRRVKGLGAVLSARMCEQGWSVNQVSCVSPSSPNAQTSATADARPAAKD
jgi:competence protein ComEA